MDVIAKRSVSAMHIKYHVCICVQCVHRALTESNAFSMTKRSFATTIIINVQQTGHHSHTHNACEKPVYILNCLLHTLFYTVWLLSLQWDWWSTWKFAVVKHRLGILHSRILSYIFWSSLHQVTLSQLHTHRHRQLDTSGKAAHS